MDEAPPGVVGKGVWEQMNSEQKNKKYRMSKDAAVHPSFFNSIVPACRQNKSYKTLLESAFLVLLFICSLHIFLQPGADGFQHVRRNGFFQLAVLRHRALGATLKKMIEAVQFNNIKMPCLAFL